MSKKTRRTYTTQSVYRSGPRDVTNRNLTSAIARTWDYSASLDVLDVLWPPNQPAVRSISPEIEDRRTFAPDGRARSTRSSRRSRIPFIAHDLSSIRSNFSVPVHIGFKAPRYVAVCVRRKQRREVLMAKGKGGGRHRRPKRNNLSSVRC